MDSITLNNHELEKRVNPRELGRRIYDRWVENGYFKAVDGDPRTPFCIVIPPPNITGSLHLGHALDNTLQDIVIRHRRMTGFNALWMPGTDHAGIATQNVVERELHKENLTRHDLGREKFVEKVWAWKEESGGKIIEQLKELGASCDWDRMRFTMDDGLSKAVREVFVRLYEEGLIYRTYYITNWCPRCHTALSDLEVEYQERKGKLYHIKYPLADGSGEITIATTRPETMLGDTAVAVNPEDDRYKSFIGKKVILPIAGRQIPVIADSYVAMDFGTGALKITPAHDPNDFEIGKRHNLETITVIGPDGKMINVEAPYLGISREECRKTIVHHLEESGHLASVDNYHHSVGECYRCKTTVEPNLSMQWFVRTKPLAEEAIKAVRQGDIQFIPASWENTYFEWMNNIRDWCISRQIWWGHRIPAWYCADCGEITVSREDAVSCSKCESSKITQDPDVLDTWFSSALWPFSTLGWPEHTEALKTFYPTSLLVTGFDIIFFWVARMIMMGLKFTGLPPFRKVYIHALIRDAEGQKMSKSKGNVIDPLELMLDYGADALRFTLCALETQGRDVRMSEKRIEGYRNFVNKLWNASRFVLMNIGDYDGKANLKEMDLDVADRWILSRLQRSIAGATDALEKFRFNDLANGLYSFTWNELCDWYIELAKPKLATERRKTTTAVLVHLLNNILRLLHPVMPFVTEEIYLKLPSHAKTIMTAPYPEQDEKLINQPAETEMQLVIEVITIIRSIRHELGIAFTVPLTAQIRCENPANVEKLRNHSKSITALARVDSINISSDIKRPPHSATGVLPDAEIFIPLEGVIDIKQETERLKKELGKVEKEMAYYTRKLENEDFLKNAPAEVLEKDRAKHDELKRRIAGLSDSISWLSA